MLIIRLVVASFAWLSAAPQCGLIFGSNAREQETLPRRYRGLGRGREPQLERHRHLPDEREPSPSGWAWYRRSAPFISSSPIDHWQPAGKSRLRAYPIGGPGSFTSEDLQVQPGQLIKWTLESDLSRSFLAIY